MSKIVKIITFLFIGFIFANAYSQSRRSHEVGIIAGSASFTTDYGQRNHFKSNVGGNVGAGIGIIYYLNFTDYRYSWNQRTTYWSEHFRVRGELSYMSAELDHFGKWVDDFDTHASDLLEAMHGTSRLINLGAQLEFHWNDIVDFGSRRIPDLQWSPYLSAGFMVNYYNPSIRSDFGDWRDPGVLYPKWDNNNFPGVASDKSGITTSITMGIGTRKKLGYYSDILIESRWQFFFSNFVDGLNARQDPSNKFNDWLMWVHVGYVYYLN